MSAPAIGGAVAGLVRRDLRLAAQHPFQWLMPLGFFILAAMILPLGVGTDQNLLQSFAPGALWLCALLAALLAQEGMFRTDYEDGTLDLLLISPCPLPLLIASRVFVQWLVTGLPAVVIAPLLAHSYGLSWTSGWILAITLLLGTPLISLLGAVGASLVVGLNRGGMLITLLVLPLCVPVLIFATAAVRATAGGLPVSGHLLLLAAMLVLAATLAPLACAAGLRASGG